MALVVAELMTLFKGDDSGVETVIKRTEKRREEIDGATATVKLDGDDQAALRSFDEVLAGLREIDSSSARATVQADIDTAQAALRELATELDDVDRTRAEAEVHAEVKRALSDLEKAERALEDLDDTVARPRINPGGLSEFRDEANSTAREAAASFDGSAESTADAFQEVAANAFAGFGPAGAAAGIAAAVGLGVALAKLNEISEEINAAKEAGAEWASSFNAATVQERVEALNESWGELNSTITDTREWYELGQRDAVTAIENISAAAEAGIPGVESFVRAFDITDPTERLSALQGALDQVNSELDNGATSWDAFLAGPGGDDAILERIDVTEQLRDRIQEQIDKQEAANEIEAAAARAAGLTVDAYRDKVAAEERATASLEAYGAALEATADPVSTYERILGDKEEAERRTAEATAAATDDATDSWEDYADDVKVTTQNLIDDWTRQASEAQEFEENLAIIAAAGGQAMADELRAKGPEVAGSVAAVIAEAGPKQQASAIAAHAAATGGSISQQMADTLVSQGWRLQRAVDGTIEAAHPKKDIVVTVTDNGSADYVKGEIADIPTSKTVTITTIRQVLGSDAGQYVLRRAGGGDVVGPGTGTSDSVLIAASNGEFVVNAKQTAKHRALLHAINSGVEGFATGGEVGAAQRDVDRAWRDVRRWRDRYWEATRRGDDRAAERAQEQRRAAEERRDDATQRRNRLRDERADVRTALRRGEIRDSVSGGLSSALGVTDQLRDLANSGDVGEWRQDRLNDVAAAGETALTRLYKQAERAAEKLTDTRDRLEELQQIAQGVRSTVTGGFGLGDVEGGVDPWTGQQTAATGAQIAAAAKEYAGKARRFNTVLGDLWKKSRSAAIVQEVAGYGVEQGLAIGEALLADLPSLRSLANSLEDIGTFGGWAGATVARAAGGGEGLWEAEQAVKAAEAQVASIDKRIDNWAKIFGRELALALGIKPRAGGGPVVAGHPYLVNEDTPNSELFIPNQSGHVLNNQQMAGLTAGPQKVVKVYVTQNYPQAIPYSKGINKALQHAAEEVLG